MIDKDSPNVDIEGHEILDATFDPNSKHLKKLEENLAQTSVGSDPFPEINHKLDTGRWNISSVLDDVVLGVEVEEEKSGWIENEFGLVTGKTAENTDQSGNKVIRVVMVGSNVKELKVGDTVCCAHDTGIKVVNFDGKKVSLIREANVFFKVEERDDFKSNKVIPTEEIFTK